MNPISLGPPNRGTILLCAVCAHEKPWGIFTPEGAAICIECRDAARAGQRWVDSKADRDQFFREVIGVLAGAVATPVGGYDSFGLLLSDIRRLREQRNVLRNALGGLIGACPQWMKNGCDVPNAMTRANEAMEST